MRSHACLRLALSFGLFVLAGMVAHAQVIFTFSTTATTTEFGYIAHNPYTFTFVTGPTYPALSNLSDSVLNSDGKTWYEEHTADSQLFQTVGGSGLSNAFTRPTLAPDDPYSYIQNSPGGYFRLYVGNDSGYDIGLKTLNGADSVVHVEAVADYLTFSSSFLSGYVDPTTYFASYSGSNSVTGTVSLYLLNADSFLNFTVTNVSLSSPIPEPSTYAALAGLGVLGSTAYRRRRRHNG